ncbi:hypothetical protein ROSA5918_18795 [Roseateles saccharophilus]|uniref:DUF2946 family protein n=2 Tax=Roseateles saccharophilus TaxID=304 RepID=A0A4R3UHK5_ROSSA|nr:hypothetical protein EV671_103811 [Roseateles saccharophilus]
MRRVAHRWLLWLALLLPIAQAMAGVHALSHVSGERQDDGIAHLVHCDLCLTAADLASGAPTAPPGPLPVGVAVEALVATPAVAAVERGTDWRPPARAPPAFA